MKIELKIKVRKLCWKYPIEWDIIDSRAFSETERCHCALRLIEGKIR